MNPLVIAPLIMGSICIFTGLFYLIIYLRLRDEKIYLSFALASFLVGLYDIFTFGLYFSENLNHGIFWQRLQLIEINLIVISMVWFIHMLSQIPSLKTLKIIIAGYSLIFILSIVINNGLTLSIQNPSIIQVNLGILKITYYEAQIGILFIMELIFIFVLFIYLLVNLIRYLIKSGNKTNIPVIAALFLLFLTTINDFMVDRHVYSFIYLFEYGFMFIIISMSWLLINRFLDLKEKLSDQLYKDSLTQLPNRKKLLLDIKNIRNPIVLLINIDSFKEVNDFYGSAVGDYVLAEMGRRLRNLSYQFPFGVYKMHGDEFVILMELDSAKEVSAHRLASVYMVFLFEAINDNIFKYNDLEIFIRVTVGAAYGGQDVIASMDISYMETILGNADIALKKAKKHNKNYLLFDEAREVNREYENNLLFAKKLREAIMDNRIISYYQPISNNSNGIITKYECLARLVDTDGGIILPIQFLEISKKTKLYSQVTRAVLHRAFDMFRNKKYEFSINLSVKDILDNETNLYLHNIMEDNPGISNRVVLEILESEEIGNYDIISSFIKDMKLYGCKFAIDDFGAGFSNFEHIIKLDLDYIKIDSSIIKIIDKDQDAYIIAKMIVNASKDLKIITIAEFVHSKEVYDKCVELGIDYSQGYYISEPKKTVV